MYYPFPNIDSLYCYNCRPTLVPDARENWVPPLPVFIAVHTFESLRDRASRGRMYADHGKDDAPNW